MLHYFCGAGINYNADAYNINRKELRKMILEIAAGIVVGGLWLLVIVRLIEKAREKWQHRK